ncbi:MAG: c-type cytochrome biogenesis protein CcmI, partial [Nitrosomonadaceae bacterium]
MTSFWVVSGIFIVGALLFILPTLLRSRSGQSGVVRGTTNVSIYRDQISELDNDLRNDILNQEQYNQSKYELQQRMMQDMSEEDPISGTQTTSKRSIATSAVIILAMPILAVSLYLLLGNTRALMPQPTIEQAGIADRTSAIEAAGHPDLEISSMVDNLVARLESQPDDLDRDPGGRDARGPRPLRKSGPLSALRRRARRPVRRIRPLQRQRLPHPLAVRRSLQPADHGRSRGADHGVLRPARVRPGARVEALRRQG